MTNKIVSIYEYYIELDMRDWHFIDLLHAVALDLSTFKSLFAQLLSNTCRCSIMTQIFNKLLMGTHCKIFYSIVMSLNLKVSYYITYWLFMLSSLGTMRLNFDKLLWKVIFCFLPFRCAHLWDAGGVSTFLRW